VGKPPYRCRIEVVFDKQDAVLFSYNTDASKNIIPYDYNYADRRLRETIYNRDRSQIVSTTEVGAPNRTVFNFVWDLLREAEQGAGLNSLVFTGLMSLDRDDSKRGTRPAYKPSLSASSETGSCRPCVENSSTSLSGVVPVAVRNIR